MDQEFYQEEWYEEDTLPADDLSHARDHLEGVIEILYHGTKPICDLDFCLQELCSSLDVYFPVHKDLKIQQKENDYFEIGKILMESSIPFLEKINV